MKDLVIFDFCETLISYQTGDEFVNYVLRKQKIKKNKIKTIVFRFLEFKYIVIFFNKFYPKFNYGKRVKLLNLRGVQFKDLSQLAKKYNDQLKNDVIDSIFNKMHEHIRKGNIVIIVSGGYDLYINFFAANFGVNYVCATKIKFDNQVCKGVFSGNDCMYTQKVIVVEDYIKQNNLKYDKSIFYTDSKSDIELMQWVDEGIVVSKNKSQKWAKEYGFKEILWKSY